MGPIIHIPGDSRLPSVIVGRPGPVMAARPRFPETSMADTATKKHSLMDRFLTIVERGGNALPHPATLFALLASLCLLAGCNTSLQREPARTAIVAQNLFPEAAIRGAEHLGQGPNMGHSMTKV